MPRRLPTFERGWLAAKNHDGGYTRLKFEPLEPRTLLSASNATAQPLVDLAPLAYGGTPYGYTPAQVRAAYGFSQVNFTSGRSSIAGNGNGQTIAIIDAYDDPTIASDLATFDRTFGLPAANFTKVEQVTGGKLPQANAGWSMEIALDVEWAHAMAPGAKIMLVEATNSSLTDLLGAVNYARNQPGVSVVSMSWGSSEFLGEGAYDSYFTTPAGHAGVSFVASSGDSGAPASWPAVSPNVLAVGGTSLKLNGSTYAGETAWVDSGGGTSRYESVPSYQNGLGLKTRGNPDVAYDANPSTGFAVYDSVAYEGYSGWVEVGGTSAGAPQWAAMLAIADQGRALAGKGPLAGAQSAIYSLPSGDFHDVVSGRNNVYAAKAGYDLLTGRGSPNAAAVIGGLIGWNAGSATSASAAAVKGAIVLGNHADTVTGGDLSLSAASDWATSSDVLASYPTSLPATARFIISPATADNNGPLAAVDLAVHGELAIEESNGDLSATWPRQATGPGQTMLSPAEPAASQNSADSGSVASSLQAVSQAGRLSAAWDVPPMIQTLVDVADDPSAAIDACFAWLDELLSAESEEPIADSLSATGREPWVAAAGFSVMGFAWADQAAGGSPRDWVPSKKGRHARR